MKKLKSDNQGMVALISVLVISAVVLMITISISSQATSEMQMSWWTVQAEKSYQLAYGCYEEALRQLQFEWQDYDQTLNLADNSCIINTDTTAERAVIHVIGQAGQAQQEITASVNTNFDLINWQQN